MLNGTKKFNQKTGNFSTETLDSYIALLKILWHPTDHLERLIPLVAVLVFL